MAKKEINLNDVIFDSAVRKKNQRISKDFKDYRES